MTKTKVQLRYSEALQNSYITRIGDHVTVKNIGRGPFETSVKALMTFLRDNKTDTTGFRDMAKLLYQTYVVPEFLQTLGMAEKRIITGNRCDYSGLGFAGREILLVDIPTAGTLVTEHIFDTLNRLPDADRFIIHKGVVDMTRIELPGGALRHDKMRVKIRPVGPNTYAVLADIMNASGGTYESAIDEAVNPRHFGDGGGISRVFVAALISSVEGIERVARQLNGLRIHSQIISVAVDPELDERKYIMPGLGDAGDRICNRQ